MHLFLTLSSVSLVSILSVALVLVSPVGVAGGESPIADADTVLIERFGIDGNGPGLLSAVEDVVGFEPFAGTGVAEVPREGEGDGFERAGPERDEHIISQ